MRIGADVLHDLVNGHRNRSKKLVREVIARASDLEQNRVRDLMLDPLCFVGDERALSASYLRFAKALWSLSDNSVLASALMALSSS